MKNLMKRGFALLMAFVMVLGLLPAMSFAVAAESSIVDYQYAYVSDTYPSVIKNWGTRGELATFLSPNAEAFYAETSLDALSALAGSADTATVHESALYVELQKLMADAHKTTTSYDATRDLYQYTDSQKNGTETTAISAFYSGTLIGPAWDGGQTWNREHTWPDSKGGNGTHENDIMMLRPEAGNVNSSRSNRAYGISEGYFNPNTGAYNLHGDVARIMLYTFVRWGGVTETADDGTVSYTNQTLLDNMWGEAGVIESLDVLLAWAEEDPVDTWELARNDSVQSITGTRNVFVDYPELVFELFEAEIPAGYDSPSGSANEAAFNITVNAGVGGEVTVNGEHVTVHPYAGYQVSSVSFSEGTTYTQNFDVFTVTSTNDCTVTVSFEELESFTVTVKENGKEVATANVYDGNIYRLPEFSGTLPEGYAFYGWATYDAGDSSTKPSVISKAGEEMTIDDNITYYAVLSYLNANDQSNAALTYELVDSAEDLVIGSSYVITAATADKALSTTQNSNNRGSADIKKSNNVLMFTDDAGVAELVLGEGAEPTEPETTEPEETEPSAPEGSYVVTTYELVTDASALAVGDKVIIAASDYNYALSTTQNGNNRGQAAITKSGNTITIDNNTQILTLAQGTANGTFAFGTGSGYLYTASSGKNYLRTETKITVNGSWAITIANGVASIVATGSSNRNVMQYNQSSGLFAAYASASQKQLALYKVVETIVEGEPAVTEPVVTEPAVTEPVEEVKTYSLKDTVNNGYLYAASSGNNYLRTQADVDANASWNISVNADGSCTLIATGANTRNNLQYNTQNSIFSCYSTAQVPVALYVGIPGGGTMYYTTSWKSDWETPIDPTNPTEAPTEETTEETTEAPTEAPVPAGIEGKYYIAAIRSSGNYFYMTSDLGTASTKRYQAVDSGLTALPASIAEPQAGCVFVVEKNEDDTYSIYAEGVEGNNYLGHTSGNSGTLVAASSALKVTVDENNGVYNVHYAASDAERFLALNGTSGNNYFAWYKSGQKQDLTLIPVVTDETTDPTEPSVPEVTEPEVTEPEADVPYATAPAVDTAYRFGMVQEKVNTTDVYYITGAMSTYYFATSTNEMGASKVYFEATEGGYYLYTFINDAKTYINMVVSGTHVNGAFEASAATVYTFDSELNTVVATVNGALYCFGTRNDKTYTTIGPVEPSKGCFIARFYPVAEDETIKAADGANLLKETNAFFANGAALPATVAIDNAVMDVAWTVTPTVEGAAVITDGTLVLTSQTTAAEYSLVATVSYNGETATATWNGKVLPSTVASVADGDYVIYFNTADATKAWTNISGDYGYIKPTDVTITDGVVSGYTNDNLFILTANGDGTYTIVDNSGRYVYMSGNYDSFNVSATKPETGADWYLYDNGDGSYFIANAMNGKVASYDVDYTSFGGYADSSRWTTLSLITAERVEDALIIADGTYLIHLSDGTAVTSLDEATKYDYLGETALTVAEDGALSGYMNKHIFTFTKNADADTYTIVDNYGRYVYMTGTYNNFNVSTEKPASGADWKLVDAGDGAVYIKNTNTQKTLANSIAHNSFGAYADVADVATYDARMHLTAAEICQHTNVTYQVVEPTLTTAGYTNVLCAACGELLYTQNEVPALGYVDTWRLTLSDSISVDFRLAVANSIIDTAQISFTVGSNDPIVYKISDVGVNDGIANDSAEYWLVSVPVAASQMQDEIKVQILNGEDATEVKTYTVESYAKTVLADTTMSKYHQVLKDMLNYGAAAQVYFQHNHEGTLPNADITGFGNEEIPAEPVTQQIAEGIVDGISFYAASLVHKERIAVRLYFKLLSGSIEDYSFRTSLSIDDAELDSITVDPFCKDEASGLYYVEFADICPSDLDNPVSIYVIKDYQTISVQYSPLDYIIRMNNKETNSDALKAMLKALYNYYLSAYDVVGDGT